MMNITEIPITVEISKLKIAIKLINGGRRKAIAIMPNAITSCLCLAANIAYKNPITGKDTTTRPPRLASILASVDLFMMTVFI